MVPVAVLIAIPCGLPPAWTECTWRSQPVVSWALQAAVLTTETELSFWLLEYTVWVAGSEASPSGPFPTDTVGGTFTGLKPAPAVRLAWSGWATRPGAAAAAGAHATIPASTMIAAATEAAFRWRPGPIGTRPTVGLPSCAGSC